ncbi:MAG: hypothetical protein QN174_11525 [Armatimonadota bacterium]|nr:hypothetical protein [Armatimonadota bacterium]MDR7455047.1 hypothetical protein [Armatimonadota bacterium]MDR7455743.1 hypothetical protein [Armatimonadota bacterium]MDR7497573.1 hypothetical protein [Armatimonadota bacterium]MDR7512688.1 hypothetical protein [Armatimonadota bacterium]
MRHAGWLAAALVLALAALPATGHETKTVGGKFRVIVGMVREPAFTNERNGLDLIVRRADNNAPVENLERSVSAVLIAPDGRTARPLKIRPQFGRPGYYTDDFILTRPGVYRFRIFGVIEDVTFDETFQSHEVRAIDELRFP